SPTRTRFTTSSSSPASPKKVFKAIALHLVYHRLFARLLLPRVREIDARSVASPDRVRGLGDVVDPVERAEAIEVYGRSGDKARVAGELEPPLDLVAVRVV